MALAHFRMLIHELLNKYPEIVPEEAPLVVLDSKSDVCMSNNDKGIKHTRHIARKFIFKGMEKNERCKKFICVN